MTRLIFWFTLAALLILHHDWWFWDDGRLIFGSWGKLHVINALACCQSRGADDYAAWHAIDLEAGNLLKWEAVVVHLFRGSFLEQT